MGFCSESNLASRGIRAAIVYVVEQVIYLEDGTPLEYAHCHYRYDHGGIVIVNNG